MGFLQINGAAEESDEFRDFLKDPSIPRSSKQDALDAVLSGLQVSDLTKNFFGASFVLTPVTLPRFA